MVLSKAARALVGVFGVCNNWQLGSLAQPPKNSSVHIWYAHYTQAVTK